MNGRSKHWVTLNEDATKILSVHYTRTRLDAVAKDNKAAFIAEAWRTSVPEGEDLVKYQQMNYGKWVYFVDLNNKVVPEIAADITPTRRGDEGRLKHWVTLNEDATEILSAHYVHTRLDKMAEDKRAAFIAEAWRSRLPGGENPDKYKLMNFGNRVYYVDLDNKAAIEREKPSLHEETPIEAEQQGTAAAPEPVEQGNYPDLGAVDITAPTRPEEEKAVPTWEPVATKEISSWSQVVTEKLTVSPHVHIYRDIIMTKEHHVWKVDRILHVVVRGA